MEFNGLVTYGLQTDQHSGMKTRKIMLLFCYFHPISDPIFSVLSLELIFY